MFKHLSRTKRAWNGLLLAVGLFAVTGCGDSGGGGGGASTSNSPGPPPPQVTAPGSGLFAVDCILQRAYVPLGLFDNATGNGQIEVTDLAVDPDIKNPHIQTIVLSHPDLPTGTAWDNDHKLILIVSNTPKGQDSKLDIIDETTNTLVAGSPFPFPSGTHAGHTGGILYNPTTKRAVISTCGSNNADCNNDADPLQGFATFDPVAHTFGPIIPANYPETFALNSATNTIVDSSDADELTHGTIGVVDLTGGRSCTLSDANIGHDHDGVSIDSTTNIAVVSNENDSSATVINLNGSSSTPSTGLPCTTNEGGLPPNSVLVKALPFGVAGSAVDPIRHQALLIDDGLNSISLLQLPSAPKTQLSTSDIPPPAISSIPDEPSNGGWTTKGDPYAVALDLCKNRGYAVDSYFLFLVQIDLATLKSKPSAISTALPAGNCKGTLSPRSCKNGNGVVFFPLPFYSDITP